MDQLPLEFFQSLHSAFEKDVAQIWNYEQSIERRSALGGTAKKTVLLQIEQLRSSLDMLLK